MSFNQYTWDLYKQTTIGIEMIKYFSDAGGYVLFKDYCQIGRASCRERV